MSNIPSNQNYLDERFEEFNLSLKYNDIDRAHDIFMELYDKGFQQEGVELEDRYDEFMKDNASPEYFKKLKEEDEANNGHPSEQ